MNSTYLINILLLSDHSRLLLLLLKAARSWTLVCTSLSRILLKSSVSPGFKSPNLRFVLFCIYCNYFLCIYYACSLSVKTNFLFWGSTFSTLGKLYDQVILLNNSAKNKIKPTKKWFAYTAPHVTMEFTFISVIIKNCFQGI